MQEYLDLLALPENTIPAELLDLITNNMYLIVFAIGFFAAAFFGYRFFKAFFPLMFASMLVGVAYTYAPALLEGLDLGIDFIDLTAAVAVVLALLGLILGRYAYKFARFLFVGYSAYEIGVVATKSLAASMPDVEFFATATGELVIGIAAAVIIAILSIFLFKFLYILVTSVSGMVGCAVLLVDAVMTTMPEWYIVVPAGAVVGILAMIFQYKNTAEYRRY